MTRKDYQLISQHLANGYKGGYGRGYTHNELRVWAEGYEAAVDALTSAFEEDNPNFSSIRFYTAILNNSGYTAKELEDG